MGRRISPDGKISYLIEWEGCNFFWIPDFLSLWVIKHDSYGMNHTGQSMVNRCIYFCCSFQKPKIFSLYFSSSNLLLKLPLPDRSQQTTDMQQSLWVINYESSPNSLDNHFNLFLSIQNNFMVKLPLLFWQITNYLK